MLLVDGFGVVAVSVGDVLFKLVMRAVAVGWQLWMTLVFGGVLFELALVVWSLTSVGRLCRCGSGAECCWLMVLGCSLGMWVDGVGRRE